MTEKNIRKVLKSKRKLVAVVGNGKKQAMEERDADGDVEIKIFKNVSRISEKYETQLIRKKVMKSGLEFQSFRCSKFSLLVDVFVNVTKAFT